MSPLWAFFYWLANYASHHQWLTLVGTTRPANVRVVYGGNIIDAWHWAQAVGGWVSQAT